MGNPKTIIILLFVMYQVKGLDFLYIIIESRFTVFNEFNGGNTAPTGVKV